MMEGMGKAMQEGLQNMGEEMGKAIEQDTPEEPEEPDAPEATPAAPEPTPDAPTGPVDEKQPFEETF